MRKIIKVTLVAFASLMLVSCTETYVKKYETACEEGDAETAAVYAGKLVGRDLDDEQTERVEKAAIKLLEKESEAVGSDMSMGEDDWE